MFHVLTCCIGKAPIVSFVSLIVSPNFELLKGKKGVQNCLSITPQHIACCIILCTEKTINKCFLNKCSKPGDSVWGSHSPIPLLKTHHTQLFWLDSLKLNLWPQPTGLHDLALAHFSDCIPSFSLLLTKLQPPNLFLLLKFTKRIPTLGFCVCCSLLLECSVVGSCWSFR